MWIEMVEQETGKLILTQLDNIATIMESEGPDPETGARYDGGSRAVVWLKTGYLSGRSISVKEDYLALRIIVGESLKGSILGSHILNLPPR
jgi:hypothetical protein